MSRQIKSDTSTNVELIPATGIVDIKGIAGQQGTVRLYERTGTGTNYVGIQPASSVTSDYTISVPGAPPGAAGYGLYTTDTAATMAWTSYPITRDETSLTIAAGVITVTSQFHRVDTEASAASDDLDTINGGTTGQMLTLTANNTARDVVCKDGTGNLKLAGDFTLNNTEDTITLIYSGAASAWKELCRSDNGA